MDTPALRPPSLLALPSYLISQVARYGYRHLESVLGEHDLVLPHHAILSALNDFGPQSQQQLALSLDLDKSHLVGKIDYLERRGLITRAKDEVDRRRHSVVITKAGKDLLGSLSVAARESQERFLDALTEPERDTLTALLRKALYANDQTRLRQ